MYNTSCIHPPTLIYTTAMAVEMCRKPEPPYPIAASIEAVREALRSSELLKAVQQVQEAFDDERYRPLTDKEREALERQGTYAEDWSQVKVAHNFNPSAVRNAALYGKIRLGVFSERVTLANHAATLPSGVYDADLCNVIVGDNALISKTSLVSNVVLGERACLYGCGQVACAGQSCFGNGRELPIAIETGGRETRIFAEITVAAAAGVASNRQAVSELKQYNDLVDEYVGRVKSEVMVVEAGAHVLSTPKVLNTYVGSHAIIDSATWVENVSLLSSKDEPCIIRAGSVVKNSIMQWGCEVDTMGMVHSSVMVEHSHVERHGMLTDSVLGPNSGVAEGEVTASLCGPFVGFHHQSLLIACFWPDGKGNVGYGANVGSNHTSKAPDQELWAGEGTFFGLGSCIKFPADFTRAPYSIIASGVTTLPQRLCIPFALVNSPSESISGLSPAYNEVFPGWVLSDNVYTVQRNEGKYKKRNKARRSTFEFSVFRPDTVGEMVRARKALQDVGRTRWADAQGQPVYTDYEIRDLGKNFLRESARRNGIITYTFYIHHYALLGLWARLQGGADPASVLEEATAGDDVWGHQQSILQRELGQMSVRDLLLRLIESQQKVAADVRISKEKDDVRGARIIPDYQAAHQSAAKDPFVIETEAATQKLVNSVKQYIETHL